MHIYDESCELPKLDSSNISPPPKWLPSTLESWVNKTTLAFKDAQDNPYMIRNHRTGELQGCNRESWHNHLMLLNAYNKVFVLFTDSRAKDSWITLNEKRPDKLWSLFHKIAFTVSPISWRNIDERPANTPYPDYFYDDETLGKKAAQNAYELSIQMSRLRSDIFDYPYETKTDIFLGQWDLVIELLELVEAEANKYEQIAAERKKQA